MKKHILTILIDQAVFLFTCTTKLSSSYILKAGDLEICVSTILLQLYANFRKLRKKMADFADFVARLGKV